MAMLKVWCAFIIMQLRMKFGYFCDIYFKIMTGNTRAYQIFRNFIQIQPKESLISFLIGHFSCNLTDQIRLIS